MSRIQAGPFGTNGFMGEGAMNRIACLHTAESNVAIFEAALVRLALNESVVLRHDVRADLLANAETAGGLTPEIAQRTADALLALCEDADAVILTCSTLGPSVLITNRQVPPVPVLRVDQALAREAVRHGGTVAVLCAVETTLRPTRSLFEAMAVPTGATVNVCLVEGAWAAFKAGDHGRYFALVAEAADQAARDGASRVALAQASMAEAAGLTRSGLRPLASPTIGLRAAVDAINATLEADGTI